MEVEGVGVKGGGVGVAPHRVTISCGRQGVRG